MRKLFPYVLLLGAVFTVLFLFVGSVGASFMFWMNLLGWKKWKKRKKTTTQCETWRKCFRFAVPALNVRLLRKLFPSPCASEIVCAGRWMSLTSSKQKKKPPAATTLFVPPVDRPRNRSQRFLWERFFCALRIGKIFFVRSSVLALLSYRLGDILGDNFNRHQESL